MVGIPLDAIMKPVFGAPSGSGAGLMGGTAP